MSDIDDVRELLKLSLGGFEANDGLAQFVHRLGGDETPVFAVPLFFGEGDDELKGLYSGHMNILTPSWWLHVEVEHVRDRRDLSADNGRVIKGFVYPRSQMTRIEVRSVQLSEVASSEPVVPNKVAITFSPGVALVFPVPHHLAVAFSKIYPTLLDGLR